MATSTLLFSVTPSLSTITIMASSGRSMCLSFLFNNIPHCFLCFSLLVLHLMNFLLFFSSSAIGMNYWQLAVKKMEAIATSCLIILAHASSWQVVTILGFLL